MSVRVLFLVNGLGLGNSTRCHAVMQALAAHGAELRVVTSGNGLWYFADKPEFGTVTEIPSLQYGKKDGRISILATLGRIGDAARILVEADRIIGRVIADFRPQVVVTDSTYVFRAVRAAGLPLVALNNSDMVVRGIARFTDRPRSVLPQFTFVEAPDCLYHRFIPDVAISPRLEPGDRAHWTGFRAVGPIVRRECRPCALGEGPVARVVIMLSGSAFGSQVRLARRHGGITVDVIGRSAPEGQTLPDNVVFHGKMRDSLPLLSAADLVIINGGFSAVSEALYLRKPMVVLPVPRHAEQWVNGRTIQDMGVGIAAAEDRLEEAMEEAITRIGQFRDGYRRLGPVPNGSVEAAEAILAMAGRDR
jgi:UDP:flavonoid glycosyltransferase YjiC (YdhE family)